MDGRIEVRDNLLHESAYEAIQFIGNATTDGHFEDDTIDSAGTFALQLDSAGSATFTHVTASRPGHRRHPGLRRRLQVVERAATRLVRPPLPVPGARAAAGDPADETLRFETDEIGKPSEPETVTVTNPTGEPERIASVSITGAFTVSTTCADELAPGASCTVEIRFVPSARGDRSGSLTISDGTSAGRYQVHVPACSSPARRATSRPASR